MSLMDEELAAYREARVCRERGDDRAAARVISAWTERQAELREIEAAERRAEADLRRARAEAASRREANERLYKQNQALIEENKELRQKA